MSKTVDEMLDEFRGQGGSYVVNPETGQRELVARTEEAPAVVTTPVEENGDAAISS